MNLDTLHLRSLRRLRPVRCERCGHAPARYGTLCHPCAWSTQRRRSAA